MKNGIFVPGLAALVLLFCVGCATPKAVVLTEGTPRHASINAALEANGLAMRLVSIIDEGTTDTYRGMTLTSYALSETEVTQGDYEEVSGPSGTQYDFLGWEFGDSYPVFFTSWYEAAAFCNDLSAMVGLEEVYNEETWLADFTKNGFYLPLEAQWEYAFGGPAHFEWSLGNTFNAADYVFDEQQPQPVKTLPPNGFGLHDMSGNLYEWCHDWHGEAYPETGAVDPAGPSNGMVRVLRGGSWRWPEADYLRADWRGAATEPSFGDGLIGFRVAAGGNGTWQ